MTRKRRVRDPFPTAVGAASAFLVASGSTLLALGLSSDAWFPESPLVRTLAIGEAVFLIVLGLIPFSLWLLARRGTRRRTRAGDEGAWRWDLPT